MDLFKDIIPSIQQSKKEVITEENEKDYVPYIVNRSLSYHNDMVMYANEMNKLPHLDNLLQYQYLMKTIRGYKRPFQKWQKRDTIRDLAIVKEYYNYSNEKAREVLPLLSEDDILRMKKALDKGGSK